jgi:4-amino-4-deoxy-L-arabinose transferase-like glycosyltransferase
MISGLGSIGLTDRDEGSNAEAAREMLETGDWISPTLNYEPRYAKPALVYWLIGGMYALGGVSEFTARLPSALFGMGLILITYLFTKRLVGPRIALMASLMLALNIETVAICRMVLTDPELVFFTTLSTLSFWVGLQGTHTTDRKFFWLFYLGMGLAMLTKGPVGFIIPLLGIIPYVSLTRQWKRVWTHGNPLLGIGLFVLIAAPWYGAMFAIHGADYIAAAQANTTGRFANPMEGHGGTLLFYLPVLFLGFFPWSGFLPGALYQAFQYWRNGRTLSKTREGKPDKDHPTSASLSLDNPSILHGDFQLFLSLWVVSLFIFFTLSATRLPHYIFPLFPAASILVALFWTQYFSQHTDNHLRWAMRLVTVIGFSVGLGLAFLPVIYRTFLDKMMEEFPGATLLHPGLWPLVAGTIVMGAVLAIRHFSLNEHRQDTAFGLACGMMTSLLLIILLQLLPQYSTYFLKPPQDLANIARLNLGPDDRLIQYGRKRPSLVFYAQQKIHHINAGEFEKFQPHTNHKGKTMIILQSHLRSQLPEPFSLYPILLNQHGFSLLSSQSMLP